MKVIIFSFLLISVLHAELEPNFDIGNYTVPTSNKLSGHATFTLKSVYSVESDDSLTVTYYLPEELDHNQTIISMTGSLKQKSENGFISLKGDKSNASCMITDKLNCMVSYHSLELDSEKTKKLLEDKFSDDPDLLDRIQIAEIFARDIIGLVILKKKEIKY